MEHRATQITIRSLVLQDLYGYARDLATQDGYFSNPETVRECQRCIREVLDIDSHEAYPSYQQTKGEILDRFEQPAVDRRTLEGCRAWGRALVTFVDAEARRHRIDARTGMLLDVEVIALQSGGYQASTTGKNYGRSSNGIQAAADALDTTVDAMRAELDVTEVESSDVVVINAAIDRSISHTEIVTVEVECLQDAVAYIDTLAHWDTDTARENDGSIDVWGWTDETPDDEQDWRIRLVAE